MSRSVERINRPQIHIVRPELERASMLAAKFGFIALVDIPQNSFLSFTFSESFVPKYQKTLRIITAWYIDTRSSTIQIEEDKFEFGESETDVRYSPKDKIVLHGSLITLAEKNKDNLLFKELHRFHFPCFGKKRGRNSKDQDQRPTDINLRIQQVRINGQEMFKP